MRGIPLRRKPDAPIPERCDRLLHIVVILPFGVDELAKSARAIDLPHGTAIFAEGGCLKHHVFSPARFDGCQKRMGIIHRSENGWHRASDMFSMAENVDAMFRVTRG